MKYLKLPLITACIVAIGVIAYYYLDASKDKHNVILSEAKNLAASTSGTDVRKTQDSLGSRVAEVRESYTASPKDFVYPIGGTRDPFQQVSTLADMQQSSKPTIEQSSLMLTGIVWDEKNPIAIIADSENNSYLVRTGEEFSGAKVRVIRPRSITIEKDGKTQELILWPAKL